MIAKILLYCLLTAGAVAGDITYTIQNIAESSDGKWIMVDNNWRKDCQKRLEVKLRASDDVPSKNLTVKAYFYDKDKKLIYTYSKPCAIWEGTKKGYEVIGMPETIRKNLTTEVYFALTPELVKLFPKAALIVFGDDSGYVVKSKNAVDPMDYEFPEKSKISK